MVLRMLWPSLEATGAVATWETFATTRLNAVVWALGEDAIMFYGPYSNEVNSLTLFISISLDEAPGIFRTDVCRLVREVNSPFFNDNEEYSVILLADKGNNFCWLMQFCFAYRSH